MSSALSHSCYDQCLILAGTFSWNLDPVMAATAQREDSADSCAAASRPGMVGGCDVPTGGTAMLAEDRTGSSLAMRDVVGAPPPAIFTAT